MGPDASSSRSSITTTTLASNHNMGVGPHTAEADALSARALASEDSAPLRRLVLVCEPDEDPRGAQGVVGADVADAHRASVRATPVPSHLRRYDAATLVVVQTEQQPASAASVESDEKHPWHARVLPQQQKNSKRRRSLEPSPSYVGTPASPDERQLLVGVAVLLEVRLLIQGCLVPTARVRACSRRRARARSTRVRARHAYARPPPPVVWGEAGTRRCPAPRSWGGGG